MKLIFPTQFEIQYPVKNKNYYGQAFKRELINVLLEAADGYCMYCGRKLVLDNEFYFNLDHSIEKDGYEGVAEPKTSFENCKFNLSLTCIKCNQKYKNKMISRVPYDMVNKELDCQTKQCKEPCREYLQALKEYQKLNKIILQPKGTQNNNGVYFNIEYDLLKQIYVPATDTLYTNEEIEFIEEHIARFNLNRDTASTCILEECELIWRITEVMPVSNSTKEIYEILQEVRFDNVIAKEFLRFLEMYICDRNMLKDFCELYIVLSYI